MNPFGPEYRSRFDDVYRSNAWGGDETRSTGPGAARDAVALGAIIVRLVDELGISSVLDVGCGEGKWMPELPGYIGVDVSEEALGVAMRMHPYRDFRLYDGFHLPHADLVLCKHVLQHMSVDDGLYLLERIRESGRWLAATTFDKGKNEHGTITRGGGYWPDLTAPPFSLGSPVRSWKEGHTLGQDVPYGGRFGLWAIA